MPLKFSVITPSFRQLEWLRLAAASVADQQGLDLEHIVQDAGTGLELETWAEKQPRLKLHVEKDSGMYDAINRGLDRASGEICAYLNCDEQYLPGTLARITSFFASHPKIDILFGDVLVVNSAGQALFYRRAIRPTKSHIRLSHLNTSSGATFFRKQLFDQGHRFSPEWKSIGDAIWIYEMLKAGIEVAVYPELLAVFTLTGANLSTNEAVSQREKQKWLEQTNAPLRFLRPWHVAAHRLRKLLAGAYRKRSLEYKIYTLASPTKRVPFTASGIGGKWKSPR